MPRGKKIATGEKIIQAVISLGLQGSDVSYRNVISHIGGGSNDTVGPFLQELEKLGKGNPFIGAIRHLIGSDVPLNCKNVNESVQHIEIVGEKNTSDSLCEKSTSPLADKSHQNTFENAENYLVELQSALSQIEAQWLVNSKNAEEFIQLSREFLNQVVLEKQSLHSEVDGLYQHVKNIKEILSQS